MSVHRHQQTHTHTTIPGQSAQYHSNGNQLELFNWNCCNVATAEKTSWDFACDDLPEPDFSLATVMFIVLQLRTAKLDGFAGGRKPAQVSILFIKITTQAITTKEKQAETFVNMYCCSTHADTEAWTHKIVGVTAHVSTASTCE